MIIQTTRMSSAAEALAQVVSMGRVVEGGPEGAARAKGPAVRRGLPSERAAALTYDSAVEFDSYTVPSGISADPLAPLNEPDPSMVVENPSGSWSSGFAPRRRDLRHAAGTGLPSSKVQQIAEPYVPPYAREKQ